MDLQTRNHYLKAMGIPVWMPKGLLTETALPDSAGEREQDDAPRQIADATPANARQTTPAIGRSMPDAVTHLLDASQPQPPKAPAPPPVRHTHVLAPDCSQLGWQELQQTVSHCQLCDLHKTRAQTVFGSGDPHARWMIIGEAPGAEEDRQGTPFVGRAGQLLNNMLAAIGLPREAVYIANTLKCRPPNNRDPKPEESALCRGYLERQIALVNPTLILVVGRIAAHNLLQVDTPLGRLRNTLHHLPNSQIPVIVTYHPAYLLRQPAEKRKAWQDLQMACRLMAERTDTG